MIQTNWITKYWLCLQLVWSLIETFYGKWNQSQTTQQDLKSCDNLQYSCDWVDRVYRDTRMIIHLRHTCATSYNSTNVLPDYALNSAFELALAAYKNRNNSDNYSCPQITLLIYRSMVFWRFLNCRRCLTEIQTGHRKWDLFITYYSDKSDIFIIIIIQCH